MQACHCVERKMTIRRKKISDEVADVIIRNIHSGRFQPSEKIPNEFEIAEELGVSRGSVREAVKSLVSRNILEIRRGDGTYVQKQPGIADDPFGLQFYEDKIKLSSDLLELRLILEPEIARLAAERATSEEIERIRECCMMTEEKLLRQEDGSTEDIAFHTAIAAASHNHAIENILPIISQGVVSSLSIILPEFTQEIILTHRAITEAISRHDADATKRAMESHLLDTNRFYSQARENK